VESSYGINAALEFGSRNYLQVVARLQRHDFLVNDELANAEIAKIKKAFSPEELKKALAEFVAKNEGMQIGFKELAA